MLRRFGSDLSGFLLVALLATQISSCHEHGSPKGFVRAGKNGFMVDDRPLFPLAVNYSLTLRYQDDSLWACPGLDYDDRLHERASRVSDRMAVRADLEIMREMGFNTVRMVGWFGQVFQRDERAFFKAFSPELKDTLLPVDAAGRYEQYLSSLREVFDEVRRAGLRVIPLIYLMPGQKGTEDHFIRVADHFRSDSVILAYDLFNEPLYFDSAQHKKAEVDRIVMGWHRLSKEHAPHHLTTIGLSGIREVFAWDPDRLLVDFVSFHPYEYEPEQVRNEMRWYSENMHVPWMIGETAIPADDDSVPYLAQEEFAERTLEQARACGAWGYSWWQYKDVNWNYFHSDFMGVMDRQGNTRTRRSGLIVQGTIKPVAAVFRTFDPRKTPGPCLCAKNYYNYSGCRTSRLTGRLVDGEGRPVRSGVIIGWNEEWSHSYHTVTRDDGRFELDGCFYFHHWMASATDHSMVRGDCEPNAYIADRTGPPSYYLGELTVERLRPVSGVDER